MKLMKRKQGVGAFPGFVVRDSAEARRCLRIDGDLGVGKEFGRAKWGEKKEVCKSF